MDLVRELNGTSKCGHSISKRSFILVIFRGEKIRVILQNSLSAEKFDTLATS